MPSLNGLPRSPAEGVMTPHYPGSMTPLSNAGGSMSPFGHRSMSPVTNRSDETRRSSDSTPPTYPDGRPMPPEKNKTGLPPTPFLRTSASAQPFQRGPSFSPNNVIPPARSTGNLPGNSNGPLPGPSFNPPNPHYGGPPFNGNPGPPQQQMYNPNARTQNQFPPGPPGAAGPYPPRPPSEPSMGSGMHKSPSLHSLGSQYSQQQAPPLPHFPPGHPNGMPPHPGNMNGMPPRMNSLPGGLQVPQPRPLLPSAQARAISMAEIPVTEPSPPNSPIQQAQDLGPVVSTVSAQMKCKVFLQQQHAQWKSLGSAKLKLYRQDPTNVKQLVVEADNKDKTVLISTIVLTDGVERVGKTGVAIELSDRGARTGIVYMIQLRNETSAGGLFDSLLVGSDRAARGGH